MHAYGDGPRRIYLNGRLDGEATTKLDIKSPARLWLGGWDDNYAFAGDPDEVRVSKVARSAEWVRLEFENQKPLQTLVGPLVQAGAAFAVSPAQATVLTKGGGDYFTMEWSVSPIAVIQEIVAGKLILTRALNSGALTVAVTQSVTSAVTELKR